MEPDSRRRSQTARGHDKPVRESDANVVVQHAVRFKWSICLADLRAVARAITTRRFGLWAIDGRPELTGANPTYRHQSVAASELLVLSTIPR